MTDTASATYAATLGALGLGSSAEAPPGRHPAASMRHPMMDDTRQGATISLRSTWLLRLQEAQRPTVSAIPTYDPVALVLRHAACPWPRLAS